MNLCVLNHDVDLFPGEGNGQFKHPELNLILSLQDTSKRMQNYLMHFLNQKLWETLKSSGSHILPEAGDTFTFANCSENALHLF